MIENQNPVILQYLRIFFRRREMFFVILFTMPLLVFNVSNFLPRVYSATTLIKINDERILNPLIGDLAISSTVFQRLKSIEEEILTWGNLSSIARDLELDKDIHSQIEYEKMITNMRKAIKVNMLSQDIIRITYKGTDPYKVKMITDKISDLFIAKNILVQTDKADQATEFIAQQLLVYQQKLDESERVFSRFRLLNDLKNAEKKKKQLTEQLNLQKKEIVSQTEKRENPLVAKFKLHLIELEIELANLMVDAKENHPRVKQIREDIANTKKQLADSIQNPQTIETRTLNPLYQDLDRQIKNTDFDIDRIKDDLSQIEAMNEQYESKALPEQELASLARDNRVNEHLYEKLLGRLETAHITKRLEDSKGKTAFEIIEKARLPLRPISPAIMQIIFSAIVISLGAAIAAVMGMEYMDTSFKNTKEVQNVFPQPVLGSIAIILTVHDLRVRNIKFIARFLLAGLLILFLASIGIYFNIN